MNQPVGGVFNKKEPEPQQAPKVDMQNEFEANERLRIDMMNKSASAMKTKMESTEATVAKANAIMSGTADTQKELDELDQISEKDQELAEALIFNGYAEFDAVMVNFPKRKFTMCSTSADDIALIDEMVFEYVKSKEDMKTGSVDLPDTNVKAFRLSLNLAVSYKGIDGKDIMESAVHHLSTIKKAISKCRELEVTGDIDKLKSLRDELKTAMRRRAAKITALPTPIIDYLSGQKYEFDSKMFSLMTTKNLLPKF